MMQSIEANDDLDFLDEIGLGDDMVPPPPATSEEIMCQIISGSRFDNIMYYLTNDMQMLVSIQNDNNIKMTINKLVNGQVINAPVSVLEFTRYLLKHYLLMLHHVKFSGTFNYEGKTYPPCDIAAVIEMLLVKNEKLRKFSNSTVDSFK